MAESGHRDDLATVRAILRGEAQPWCAFLQKYADRILRTAHRWCSPTCRRRSCPYSTSVGAQGLERYLRSSCDEMRDVFAFIIKEIWDKALPAYQGRCSLNTFLFRILNPVPAGGQTSYGYRQLYADYLRHRLGRLRLPKIAAQLLPLHRAIFEKLCGGWSRDRICQQLGITPGEAEEAEQEIRRLLIRSGWRHYWYWVGFRSLHEVPFSWGSGQGGEYEEEDRETAVSDPSSSPEQLASAHQVLELLRDVMRSLPAEDQELLQRMYAEGLHAQQVARQLGCKPRDVYRRRDEALGRLHAGMKAALKRDIPLAGFRSSLKGYLREIPPSEWANHEG